jgi:hypothetical protein
VPSQLHEAVIELLRGASRDVRGLLRDVAGLELPAELDTRSTRIVEASAAQLVAPARMCDLAFEIPRQGSASAASMMFEVQQKRDREKTLAWPILWAQMHARVAGGPVWLVVITTRVAVEAWAAQVLADVIPRAGGWSVVGPSSTRRITTQAAARRDPSAALLSAMIHAGSRDEDLVAAIAGACSTLDADRGKLFLDAVSTRLTRKALEALELHMQKSGYVWKSEFARRHRAEGHAEGLAKGREVGREEGREEGCIALQTSLLAALRDRGLPVSREQRARILRCRDLGRLAAWMAGAVTATSVSALLAGRVRPSSRARAGAPRRARPRAGRR